MINQHFPCLKMSKTLSERLESHRRLIVDFALQIGFWGINYKLGPHGEFNELKSD